MEKITESTSNYDDLELMSTGEILTSMNKEDQKVAVAVEKIIPEIEAFVDQLTLKIREGGRLFYVGAGTSGRLGIVDASECPPTFGVPHGLVIGMIAGGDSAIRKAVEFAEDDTDRGWQDLNEHQIDNKDCVIGIAASGTTPYVVGALEKSMASGILTAGITCNPGSPVALKCDHPLIPIVGPEFVTGSTRLKSGPAQKLILNMITTALMIKLGRVKGNKMVDMQLSNNKLVERGTRMVMNALSINHKEAQELLMNHGSVRGAIQSQQNQ